ncbi:MAG TPA: T9SS type A sorting domain-containing protein [Bacteroidales bacterium]|nr:T9SS type A sorting domain-containing protein [Bacteroidales bacterium]
MKRVLFFVLFVFLLISAESQNLVINPGLETWESSTKPAGWTTATKCSSELSTVHSGSYSCIQTGTSSSRGDLGQLIAVTPGKSYNLSFFYRTGILTTGVGARLWCYWKDAGGASITDAVSDPLLRNTAYLSAPEWTQYLINITAPASAVAIYLEVRTYLNSVTYWDDFVFQEGLATGVSDDFAATPALYPVPAGNYLNIKNASGIQSFEILDLSGTVVKSVTTSYDPETSIYVGELAKGFYILRMRYQGRCEMRKFLKD